MGVTTTQVREPVEVLGLPAAGGTAGAKEAFRLVESRLPTLRGRRFYGVVHPDGSYFACFAERDGDDPAALALDRWVLPGGLYARTAVLDWTERLPEIGACFGRMASLHTPDPSRPSIEFYRSRRELVLLMPILGPSDGQGSPIRRSATEG